MKLLAGATQKSLPFTSLHVWTESSLACADLLFYGLGFTSNSNIKDFVLFYGKKCVDLLITMWLLNMNQLFFYKFWIKPTSLI
jgi:hypothetical protein